MASDLNPSHKSFLHRRYRKKRLMELEKAFTPQALEIIKDDKNWSKKYMMESCALCKQPFKEDYVPLHLWKNNGDWSISFHMKCAFGDKVVESDGDFEEDEDEFNQSF